MASLEADNRGADTGAVTPQLMRDISAAFNSRDVERIVAYFADDATFYLARGPEPQHSLWLSPDRSPSATAL